MTDIVSPIQDVGSEDRKAKQKKLSLFIREQLFPALCEATNNINDADIFLQTFSTMIMENFLQIMKEKKFSEFNLALKLNKDDPKYENLQKVVHLFDDMNVREAQDIIDGMKNELRFFYSDEMKNRKLESLKVNWLPT